MDTHLMQQAIDYGIIGLLGFMAFMSLWFWIERLLFYRGVKLEQYNTKEALQIDLTNHLGVISSFGSNAPYIGLLGTVFGIILTFYIMGQSGNLDAKSIMTSLALALKATAMGLGVAIPAIFFHTHLVRRLEVLVARWEIMQKEGYDR
jgi:biopolymer transport protein ExbB